MRFCALGDILHVRLSVLCASTCFSCISSFSFHSCVQDAARAEERLGFARLFVAASGQQERQPRLLMVEHYCARARFRRPQTARITTTNDKQRASFSQQQQQRCNNSRRVFGVRSALAHGVCVRVFGVCLIRFGMKRESDKLF